eukprot:g427.t1
MTDCLCVPEEVDGYEWNRWVGQNLHECIYTPQDWAAFVIGWMSLGFWFCCQLPQYYKNYQTKSADALSIVFLLEWFSGDLLNLISSIMTGQLTTQIATAALFICMDLSLCVQWFYYSKVYPTLFENGHTDASDRTSPLVPRSSSAAEDFVEYSDVGDHESESKHDSRRQRPTLKSFALFTPFLFLWFFASSNGAGNAAEGVIVGVSTRRLMSTLDEDSITECDATAIGDHTSKVVGVVLAYCSALVYVTSRLPQILKNYTRGSVQGLSPYMFGCAVMGNLTYALGVLVKRPSSKDIVSALPFLIGSLGTICFDCVILVQYFYYLNAKPKGDRPPYERIRTEVRDHIPRGIHNIVDPMASPFFAGGKRVTV